jgi:citrate synthase
MENPPTFLRALIADVLNLHIDQITPDLAYQSIPEWSSLTHIQLMTQLQKELNCQLCQNQVTQLTSVQAIYDFCLKENTSQSINAPQTQQKEVIRGLNQVAYDYSNITDIDGQNGTLQIKGFPIASLVKHCSYESMLCLLLDDELPNAQTANSCQTFMAYERDLPEKTVHLIKTLSDLPPDVVLRTAVSSLQENKQYSDRCNALSIIAKLPTILGYHQSFQQNNSLPEINRQSTHVQHLWHMLQLTKYPEKCQRILEKNMIIQSEHGSNASTFAARVSASTEASVADCFIAAMATFSGPLHGGAINKIMPMIDSLKTANNLAETLEKRLTQGLPIYGFGHRVYKKIDPRAPLLKENARELSALLKDTAGLERLEAIEHAMRPKSALGLCMNVDFYAVLAYQLMGISDQHLLPIFSISRSIGWLAHILEQKNNNILIRPRLKYTGKTKRFPDEHKLH